MQTDTHTHTHTWYLSDIKVGKANSWHSHWLHLEIRVYVCMLCYALFLFWLYFVGSSIVWSSKKRKQEKNKIGIWLKKYIRLYEECFFLSIDLHCVSRSVFRFESSLAIDSICLSYFSTSTFVIFFYEQYNYTWSQIAFYTHTQTDTHSHELIVCKKQHGRRIRESPWKRTARKT